MRRSNACCGPSRMVIPPACRTATPPPRRSIARKVRSISPLSTASILLRARRRREWTAGSGLGRGRIRLTRSKPGRSTGKASVTRQHPAVRRQGPLEHLAQHRVEHAEAAASAQARRARGPVDVPGAPRMAGPDRARRRRRRPSASPSLKTPPARHCRLGIGWLSVDAESHASTRVSWPRRRP